MEQKMEKSFETLKLKLIAAPLSAYSDYQKYFLFCTNASNKATGAVLSQLDDNRREDPVHYASRVPPDTESNYPAFER